MSGKFIFNKILQQTVSRPLTFRGVGLHSGRKCEVKVCPAFSNEGIIFNLQGNHQEVNIPADFRKVISTMLCTTLGTRIGKTSVSLRTVEHLMAALYAANVHNAYIHVTSNSASPDPEVPILDGSAAQFARVIAGNVKLSHPETRLPIVKVIKPIFIEDKAETGATAELLPLDAEEGIDISKMLVVSISLDSYNNKLPARNIERYTFDSLQTWINEVGQARTFVFESEVESLRRNNLGIGGSLRNCVVYDDVSNSSPGGKVKVLNRQGLRNTDEWLWHKLLDVYGDLSLIRPLGILNAHFRAFRPGHSINNQVLHALENNKDSFVIL